jgi:diaminopimelate decarboxylase
MHIGYRGARLFVEELAASEIAERHGTPLYVYSGAVIRDNWRAADAALAGRRHLICYSVKANSNLSVLALLARLGSGFDIVSGGELERVLAAGGEASKTVFAGVGKSEPELRRALEVGVHCFSVESRAELERLSAIAVQEGRCARVALRVNPDVDAATHPHISTGQHQNKFGIPIAEARALYLDAATHPWIEFAGVGCHIGSQLTRVEPLRAALERVMSMVRELRGAGIELRHVDIGGGLGIRYRDEEPPSFAQWAAVAASVIDDAALELIFAPGRSIVGAAGILLTRVEYLKTGIDRNFAIVDAGMNDLLRPALYDAWHDLWPVVRRSGPPQRFDIVGPVCESGDFIARDRLLALEAGDLLAVAGAGAYGFAMSSTYNSRPRPAEVMVEASGCKVIRRRETIADLLAPEIGGPR